MQSSCQGEGGKGKIPARKLHGACYRGNHRIHGSDTMSIATILIVVLVLLLIGALPTWPHSASWGYMPSGVLGTVLVVLLVLWLLGQL